MRPPHRQRRDSGAPRAVSLFSPAHGSAGRAAALPGAASQKLSARREPADRPGRPALFPLRPQGAGGHGSRTRVSPQPLSASAGRAGLPVGATTRAARRGRGEGRGETRPEPAANSAPARRSGGSAPARRAPRGAKARPKRDCNAFRLPSPPGPPAPGPGRGPEHFPPPRGNSRGRRPARTAGAHLAPRRSLAQSLPRRERRVRVRVRLPASPPPPRGSRGPARSAPAAPPHVRAWPEERGGSAGGARVGALLRSGRGGALAAERDASRPPRAARREHYGIGPPAPPGGEGGSGRARDPAAPPPPGANEEGQAGPRRAGSRAAGGGALWWRHGGRARASE